jgi:hypothetical protein
MNPIIPTQSPEHAAQSILTASSKKIKKRKLNPTVPSPTSDPVVSNAMGVEPDAGHFDSGKNGSEEVDHSPAFENVSKPARKTFSRYTIHVKSISCLAHILAHVAEYYPVESSRYMNNFRYKYLNTKTSECECAFQSHLTQDELVNIVRMHPNPIVRESADTIQLTSSGGKKKNASLPEQLNEE